MLALLAAAFARAQSSDETDLEARIAAYDVALRVQSSTPDAVHIGQMPTTHA
jgi:hypothetical protein